MFSRSLSRACVLVVAGIALLLAAAPADAGVVSAPTVTVKRFTGLLSGSGPTYQSPGATLSPTADWVDFICDPLSLHWKIRVIHTGPFSPTFYINDPHICDHVEILMVYYTPQISFPE